MNDRQLKTPDITPVAIGSFLVLMATNALIFFGVDLTDKRATALSVLINGLAIVAFLIHDAWIRNGRSRSMIVPPKGEVEITPTVRRTTGRTTVARKR